MVPLEGSPVVVLMPHQIYLLGVLFLAIGLTSCDLVNFFETGDAGADFYQG
jgi:hypothetical protein